MRSLALGPAGASLTTLSLHLPSSPTSPVGGLLLLLRGQLETGQEVEGRNIHFYLKVLYEKKFALPKLGIKP